MGEWRSALAKSQATTIGPERAALECGREAAALFFVGARQGVPLRWADVEFGPCSPQGPRHVNPRRRVSPGTPMGVKLRLPLHTKPRSGDRS
jgi:hypothetical protein